MARGLASRLWGGGKLVDKYPDDDVYPLHMLDSGELTKKLVVAWVLRFDDVLDAEKLHGALGQLFEIGDWRKLGGRLRPNDSGELQIRVPKTFTAARPAIAFTHDDQSDIPLAEHPLASQLPSPTTEPSVHPGPEPLFPLAGGPDTPHVTQDLVGSDRPVVSLRVTTFRDATTVGLVWPHLLMDAVGRRDMLRAWSLVLAGRMGEVPRVRGAQADVLREALDATAVESPPKPMVESQRMTTTGVVRLLSRLVYERVVGAAAVSKIIFLPRSAVAAIYKEARDDVEELAKKSQDDAGNGLPGQAQAHEGAAKTATFISESDAIVAWLSRAVARAEQKTQSLTIFNAVNMRYRLGTLRQSADTYLQNMILASFTFIPGDSARGSLGTMAAAQRRCTTEQTTEGELLALLREMRGERDAGREFKLFFGDPDAVVLFFNDLTKVDVCGAADFAPAVVRRGGTADGGRIEEGGGARSGAGRAVYYHMHIMQHEAGVRNFFLVLGKDGGGNLWAVGTLLPRTWEVLERELEGIRM